MFQRALALHGEPAAIVRDPCCGSGYLLTVLALLHRRQITAVLGTDIEPAALHLAEQNLALFPEGLAARRVRVERGRAGRPRDAARSALRRTPYRRRFT